MSVETIDHWTNHLNAEEEVQLDNIELELLWARDRANAYAEAKRRLLQVGTSRMRRAKS